MRAKFSTTRWVKPSKRIFNNAKISDHFAIVPSGQVPHGLDEVQQKIYDMIVRRFIAVFFPAAQFEVTTRITRVEKDAFKTGRQDHHRSGLARGLWTRSRGRGRRRRRDAGADYA